MIPEPHRASTETTLTAVRAQQDAGLIPWQEGHLGLPAIASAVETYRAPVDVRLISPPRFVLVERDGQWFPGELRAWPPEADGWIAHTFYTVAPGMRHLDCVCADREREASADKSPSTWTNAICVRSRLTHLGLGRNVESSPGPVAGR